MKTSTFSGPYESSFGRIYYWNLAGGQRLVSWYERGFCLVYMVLLGTQSTQNLVMSLFALSGAYIGRNSARINENLRNISQFKRKYVENVLFQQGFHFPIFASVGNNFISGAIANRVFRPFKKRTDSLLNDESNSES